MHDEWPQEEDVLACDEVIPLTQRTGHSPVPKAHPMRPGNQPERPSAFDKSSMDYPLRSNSGPYDLTPYWSRRTTHHEQPLAQSRQAKPVPCCTEAMRISLQRSGRRVLCLSCQTIYRFGRPIGHAPVQRLEH